MKSFFSKALSIGAVLSLAAAVYTGRAQVKSVSTDELTRQSDVVVIGKVAGMKSGWNSDRSRIFTTVTVAVDQTLKGDAGGASTTILIPGGEVDGVGELYSHTAQFRKDEEVVVFARKDKQGRLRVVAGEHGKLSVSEDAATGARLVSGAGTLTQLTQQVKAATGEIVK